MGTGKSTKMIEFINSNIDTDNRYLYITPYLPEVDRVKKATNNRFHEPKNETRTKYADIMSLLHKCKNIVSTHALFMDFNDTVEQLIVAGDYTLILDEVTTPVKLLKISKHDMKLLLGNNHISVDDEGYIVWNPNHIDYDGDFNWVKGLSLKHCLMAYGNLEDDDNCKFVVWSYPAEIFRAFKEVYILTYMFNGCLLSPYFQINSIPFKHCTLDGNMNIVPYSSQIELAQRKEFHKLINIHDSNKLNYIGKENSLSKTWFREQDKLSGKEAATTILKKNIYNYFKNVVKANADEALWTTFKDYRNKIKPRSFANSFLECNARATNDYRHKSKLAYCLNRYENPFITNYFAKKNITIDQSALALSEMLQWVWRSQIRDNKPIDIYIPSTRMRSLLQDWLACKSELKVAI